MKAFRYASGEEVRPGDRIRYHNEQGTVEFVVSEKCGDAAMDWYVDRFSGGGFMMQVHSFGSVFLSEEDIDDKLEFIERKQQKENREG